MRTTKPLLKYIIIYLTVIFVFGTIYWAYWYLHPDSFIINDQFNLQPFSSPKIQGSETKDLRFFQHKTDSIRNLIKENEARLPLLLATSDSLAILAKVASDKNQRLMWDRANSLEVAQVPDSMTRRAQALSTAIEVYGSSPGNDLARAKLSLEKAELEYRIGVIKARAGQYVLDHLASFVDSVISKDASRIDSLWAIYEFKKVPEAEQLRNVLNYELQQLKFEALNTWSKRLSYLDFILFSASNATTVTYGEMMPNDVWMRLLLIVQAIVCIILIAVFIERIGHSQSE